MWFNTPKKLTLQEVDKLLKQIQALDPLEREYVKGLFRSYESGGITAREVEEVVRDMRTNLSDKIDPQEAEKVKAALFQLLK